ncbi:unnamed protein product [Enterobius vermicularis]|uniref:AAA domain-containing protein n=1 Tax=Enterobius vermicularis TaxID=51028 RepID=A0A0N4VCD9_ENTVE|nr:unnamed protein product [Enterobius vermicularis]
MLKWLFYEDFKLYFRVLISNKIGLLLQKICRFKSFFQRFLLQKYDEVTWDDIGGLDEVKKLLQESMDALIYDRGYKRSGILLYGPPGCGKTLLAKALATQYSFPILNIKGPELLSKYVGESEANVRKVFANARQIAPCVIFFDELDSLAPRRGRSGDSGGVTDRIVSQLLTEMDDIENESVFILGATNRVDLLDPSVLTPGRFDKVILVEGGKDANSQLAMLKAASRKVTFAEDVVLPEIISSCNPQMTGAEMYSLVSRAMMDAIRERIDQIEDGKATETATVVVTQKNLLHAVKELFKS